MANELMEIFSLLVPISAIVMGISAGMIMIWTDYKRKREMFELHHKERLLAIERGMEVPPLPPEFFQHRNGRCMASPTDTLRRGLVWLLVGLALMVALALNSSLESAAWGLLPVAIGLANLIYYAVVGRHQPTNPAQQPGR